MKYTIEQPRYSSASSSMTINYWAWPRFVLFVMLLAVISSICCSFDSRVVDWLSALPEGFTTLQWFRFLIFQTLIPVHEPILVIQLRILEFGHKSSIHRSGTIVGFSFLSYTFSHGLWNVMRRRSPSQWFGLVCWFKHLTVQPPTF